MKLSKRLLSFVTALLVSLSSLFVFLVPQAHAVAVTRTWTGGGADTNMTTVGNWGGTAPLAGDDLVFPANISAKTVVNNYSVGTSFNSITFSGVASSDSNYTLSGNGLIVVAGITNSMTGTFRTDQTISAPVTLGGNQTITVSSPAGLDLSGAFNLSTYNLTIAATGAGMSIDGAITGSGTITKTGTKYLSLSGDNSAYTGAITISAGYLYAGSANAIATSGGTTISDGAQIVVSSCSSATLNGNLTLTGASDTPSGDNAVPKFDIYYGGCSGGGGGFNESYGESSNSYSAIFTGNIALGSDVTFGTVGKDVTLTGTIAGSHAINLLPGWSGKLIINAASNGSTTANGTYSPAYLTKTLSDSLPSSTVGTSGNVILTVDGTRSDVNIGIGGILNGTGTVGNLLINTGATVAPGHSPGCLVVGAGLTLGGTYQAELGGTTVCSGYDQLKVTGTVVLGTGTTLTTSLYGGFKPTAGNTFTIIDNDLADAVTGTFTGLAEGATFTVDGYVFKISYVGGDGNDVVLTTVSVPAVPDTGFTLLRANPFLSLAATIAMTAALVLGFRKLQTVRAKN